MIRKITIAICMLLICSASGRLSGAVPEGGEVVFTFKSGDSGFFRDFGRNAQGLETLTALMEACRDEIASGDLAFRVTGHCASLSSEAENVKLAKLRNTYVRSFLILRCGFKSGYFRVAAPVTSGAEPRDGVTVTCLYSGSSEELSPEEVLAAKREQVRRQEEERASGATHFATGVETAASPRPETPVPAPSSEGQEGFSELESWQAEAGIEQPAAAPRQQSLLLETVPEEESVSAAESAVSSRSTAEGTVQAEIPGFSDASDQPDDDGWRPFLGVKTNLLRWLVFSSDFDLTTSMANLAAEYFFAERWSVAAGMVYCNWNTFGGSKQLYALAAYEAEPRFWLRRDALYSGFYVGVYGQWGTYDKQEGIVGTTGSFFGGGLSCGYVQPLSRHWFLETGVRLGYRSAKSDLYDIEPPYNYYNHSESGGKFAPSVQVGFGYRFGKPRR